MPTHSSPTELRAMQKPDLLREMKAQVILVEKLRLGIRLQKEKDTARYRREKKVFARMQTEWHRKNTAERSSSHPS
ncbi:MAG: hypothetical protein PHS73_04160 [Candidatus Peribacteraceae bacterium]|nr:hypothetical protein [Candidatus Peribacteraceae bacterium]